jgi:hypothetical protein
MSILMRSDVSKRLVLALLSCLAIACNRETLGGEQLESVERVARESTFGEIENFMECRMPFHPTARFRELINKRIIPAAPLAVLDGVPHFAPTRDITFYGQSVLLIAAFDPDEWDELYRRSPGTMASSETVVYVAGQKATVMASVPPSEREQLFFREEDPSFLNWLRSLRIQKTVKDSVTVIKCFRK